MTFRFSSEMVVVGTTTPAFEQDSELSVGADPHIATFSRHLGDPVLRVHVVAIDFEAKGLALFWYDCNRNHCIPPKWWTCGDSNPGPK